MHTDDWIGGLVSAVFAVNGIVKAALRIGPHTPHRSDRSCPNGGRPSVGFHDSMPATVPKPPIRLAMLSAQYGGEGW